MVAVFEAHGKIKIHIDEGNSSYLFLCETEYTPFSILAGASGTPDCLPGDCCHLYC